MQIEPTFKRFDELQLENAREEYQHGGKKALDEYLDHLDHVFTGSHYVLDQRGVDMVTGRGPLEPAAACAGDQIAPAQRRVTGSSRTVRSMGSTGLSRKDRSAASPSKRFCLITSL